MSDNMIEYIKTYKVANGYVTQIKILGISTEMTFVSEPNRDLGASIASYIVTALETQV